MHHTHYHLIGIGGIGMSALARILLEDNVHVSGSDLVKNQVVEALLSKGANITIGHEAKAVSPGATVVYSTGVRPENPEFKAAKELNCPLLHRSELLAHLMQGQKVLAVAGSHGKTTTSSLLAYILQSAGYEPSFAIGGVPLNLGVNGCKGTGSYFVAEADESDGSFLNYSASGAIVTNIDDEHLNHYGTFDRLCAAFSRFLENIENAEWVFVCGDDQPLHHLAAKGVRYGFSEHCALRASNLCGMRMDIDFEGKTYKEVELPLLGRHQALNALAVFGLCLRLGLSEEAIRHGLKTFRGVARRCEKKLEREDLLLLDDYGHHPTEVRATLEAIREAVGERRLIVAFQPHRYSRTRDCAAAFGKAFEAADEVWMTDLYSAGEAPIEGISSKTLIEALHRESFLPVRECARERLVEELAAALRPHDVAVFMGAGDITKAATELALQIGDRPLTKYKVGLIMGGKNSEHEVSLESSKTVAAGLDPRYYTVQEFGVTKEGKWVAGPEVRSQLKSHLQRPVMDGQILQELLACDLLVPVLHGPLGEDGMLSAFFETLNKPYVGCDYRSASLCMDKALLKKLLLQEGIPTAPFISFSRYEWQKDKETILKNNLPYPVFVKPTHLGSSIAVTKVAQKEALEAAIEKALSYDTHCLVEQGLTVREIEFAVLGNDNPISSCPGEIDVRGEVYDYQRKYGSESASTHIPAPIDQELASRGMALALKAYKLAGCCGLARVDTFLDETGKFWLNEINPLPGFTRISLYPKAWEATGLPMFRLLDRLVILGLQRKRWQDRYLRTLATVEEA